MQPGEDSTVPRPEILPLLRGHGGGEHVQPPTHDQVGISSLFPLQVRSGFVDHKQPGQRRQRHLERRLELLSRRALDADIIPGAQVCAPDDEGPCGLGRARVEGEVLADEPDVGGEGGVDVHVEACVGLVFSPLVGGQGHQDWRVPVRALVVESGAGDVRREKAAAGVRERVLEIVGDVERVANDPARGRIPQHGQRVVVGAIGELTRGRAAEPLADVRDVEDVDPSRLEGYTFEAERETGLGRIGRVGAGLYG